MFKGKNLWYVVGIGAVAYYFWWMNKKNKAAKVIETPATNFTGDLDVPAYQNADGQFSQGQLARLRRIAANNPQRAQKVAARMFQRNM